MKQNDYSRFYALLKRMAGDRKVVKEALVARFTKGRSVSLRDMRREEYKAMCDAMEAEAEHPGMSSEEYRSELKRMRSAALKRMQRLGVDTADWDAVDNYCMDPRIAIGGPKRFAVYSLEELKELVRKLQAILNKPASKKTLVRVPILLMKNRLPS